MYLPKPIYELLPFLYFVVGLLATFNTDPIYGRIAGILLALVGVVIYKMRVRMRSTIAKI